MKKTLSFILGLGLLLGMAASANAQCHPFRQPPKDSSSVKCKADFCYKRVKDSMVSVTNNSKGATFYQWIMPDGTKSNSKNIPDFTLAPGTYTLCLVAGDSAKNCVDTLCKQIVIPAKPCDASFKVALDTSMKNKLYLVNTSSDIPGHSYFYSWTFGDDSTSNDKNPKHRYAKFGKYEICLLLFDSTQNCVSLYCDSLGLDSNGKMLKAEGFDLEVIPQATSSISSNDTEQPTLYPNPTGGIVNVKLGSYQHGELKVEVMNMQGETIETQTANSNTVQIDLGEYANGFYMVSIFNNHHAWIYKLVKTNPSE